MPDPKYGRIFTEAELKHALAVATGNPKWDDEETVVDTVVVPDPKFPADEPLMVLRGQDEAAKNTIRHYRDIAEGVGAERSHLDSARKTEEAFAQFARENSERMKIPD